MQIKETAMHEYGHAKLVHAVGAVESFGWTRLRPFLLPRPALLCQTQLIEVILCYPFLDKRLGRALGDVQGLWLEYAFMG